MQADGVRSNNLKFRQDINGLRAIAVAAVCLFHFKVPGFAGGFVGVDVSFVISGYLMTAILLSARAHSASDFYWARFTRIYPPMLALVISVIAMGYWFLAPEEFATLGRRAVASVFSVANL